LSTFLTIQAAFRNSEELRKIAMDKPMIIPGRYSGKRFIPDGPLPEAEGKAELIITPAASKPAVSISDAFGKAAVLRSGDEILAQLRSDREEWGDR